MDDIGGYILSILSIGRYGQYYNIRRVCNNIISIGRYGNIFYLFYP